MIIHCDEIPETIHSRTHPLPPPKQQKIMKKQKQKTYTIITNQLQHHPKTAIVFGTEAVGCSTEILHASNKRVYFPLRGFADSLNISAATALVVHQLFLLDPTMIGSMDEKERMALRKMWYTKLATQRIQSKSEKA